MSLKRVPHLLQFLPVLLFGLATPVQGSDSPPLSLEEAKQYLRYDDHANVYIARSKGLSSSTVYEVEASGALAGRLTNREFFGVKFEPGTHEIIVREVSKQGAAGENGFKAQFELDLDAGSQVFISCGKHWKTSWKEERSRFLPPSGSCPAGSQEKRNGVGACTRAWDPDADGAYFCALHAGKNNHLDDDVWGVKIVQAETGLIQKPQLSAYAQAASEFDGNLPGFSKVYFRRDHQLKQGDAVMEVLADGEPLATLAVGEFTMVTVENNRKPRYEIEMVEYGADNQRIVTQQLARFSGNGGLFVSCGPAPLPQVRLQYFILPEGACASAGQSCPAFDKTGKLCAAARWVTQGKARFCGTPYNWTALDTMDLAGDLCVVRPSVRARAGDLFSSPWPDESAGYGQPHTAFFTPGRKQAGTLVEPVEHTLHSPESEARYAAIAMSTVSAYTAYLQRFAGHGHDEWAGRQIIRLKWQTYQQSQTLEDAEDYLATVTDFVDTHGGRAAVGNASLVQSLKGFGPKVEKMRLARMAENQQCKPADARYMHSGDACRNGRIHGETTIVQLDGKRQIQGRFEDGKLIEGAKYYADYNGSWGIEYEGEWSLGDPYESGKPQFIRHGEGRSYGLNSYSVKLADGTTQLQPVRYLSYEGVFRDDAPHGKGLCRPGRTAELEACEYAEGLRVDEVFRLRQELARQRKHRERCGQLLHGAADALVKARERLSDLVEPDNNMYGCLDDTCVLDRKLTFLGYSTGSVASHLDSFRSENCPDDASVQSMEAARRDILEQVEWVKDRHHQREAARERQYREEKAAERRALREAEERMWREAAQGFMQPDESWRAIEAMQEKALADIADHKARSYKSYGGNAAYAQPDKAGSSIADPAADRLEAQLAAAEKAAAVRVRAAEKKCRDEGRRWLGDRCDSKTNITRFPGRACYDKTGKHCKTGETLGSPSSVGSATGTAGGGDGDAVKPKRWAGTRASGNLGGGNSRSGGKTVGLTGRGFPVFVQKEGKHGWPTQEEACTYAKEEAIRLAKKKCRLDHDGTVSTKKDVPKPIDANCQSYRQMDKDGFTYSKGQWKTTGNVILYCKTPEP